MTDNTATTQPDTLPRTHADAHTLAEIAHELGISRQRVRQIEQAALRKLKKPEVVRRLRGYLEG
jgi:DNA-directed RNA polymerase sigma subunit (sigma70/sigma32)